MSNDLAPAARGWPRATAAIAGALAAVLAGFGLMLWPEWRRNPDLSHGFLAPVVFALLVLESRRAGPVRWLPVTAARSAALGGLLLASLALFLISGLLAASVGWSHALVLFVLSTNVATLLLAGLVVLAGDDIRAVPFNWISLTAILLWVLVAPLPHGTYARLTLALQGWVTDGVLAALQILGVPARQRGNVIELATTTVGVEEACSGIRSLLSCLYAGFFFAAWQVRRAAGRAVLIIAAPLLAIGMNFVRSLALTLMADAGIDIAGFWHDATGFAILALTAAVLAALAWGLGAKGPARDSAALPAPGRPPRAVAVLFWSGSAALLAVMGFFLFQSRPAAGGPQAPPDLAAILPAQAAGWEVTTRPDLYRFSGVLQTEHLFERTYRKHLGEDSIQLTVYIAWWPAGRVSVSMVASHTPDACWPGAGWSPITRPGDAATLAFAGRTLPPAQQRLFRNGAGITQQVWFWQIHDGRVIDPRAPYSVPALLRNAVDYGFQREGHQAFVRVSSNQPWTRLANEPLVHAIAANLAGLGL